MEKLLELAIRARGWRERPRRERCTYSPQPKGKQTTQEKIDIKRTLKMIRNPYAAGFSGAIALYVATEVAIYVWMPTLLKEYSGNATWFATYALTVFFVLRAGGRFPP